MKTNLLDIENQLLHLNSEYKEKTAEHERFIELFKQQKDELLRQKSLVMSGLDLDKIKNAESILLIDGLKCGEYNDRCVTEAIKDIASGTNTMAKQYFGVKNYAHWTHQESDHPYGYGPSHGYIVFRIGLRNRSETLTNEQKEDCLYYLNLIRNKEARNAIANFKKEFVS